MKSLMRHAFFLGVIMFFANSTRAQESSPKDFLPGFITKQGGQKITGWIKYTDHNSAVNACLFRSSPSGQEETFKASDLVDYGIDGKKYFRVFPIVLNTLAQSPSPEPTFMECFIRGKVSLYYYKDRLFVSTGESVAELLEIDRTVEKDGKTFTINDPVYRAVLKNVMSDCPTIDNELKRSRLYQKNLIDLFKRYHNCTNRTFEEFSSQVDNLRVDWIIGAGATLSTLKLNANDATSFQYMNRLDPDNSTTFHVSAFCEVSRPAFSPRFKTRIGIRYVHNNKYSYATSSQGTGLAHDLDIETSWIDIPLQAKFQFLPKFPAYVMVGPSISFLTQWSNKEVVTLVPSGTTYSVEDNNLTPSKLFVQLKAGAGIDILPRLGLEFHYGLGLIQFKTGEGDRPSGMLSNVDVTLNWGF